VWLILLAAATAPHMRITLLSDQLRGPAALVLSIVRTLFVLALLALLVNGALTLEASFGNDRYVTLGISRSWYWTAAIVGGLLWAGTLVTGLLAGARQSTEAR
ncbi:MAG: TRAP transporter small permease subunit, partial [Pseudomonadota bacterium]